MARARRFGGDLRPSAAVRWGPARRRVRPKTTTPSHHGAFFPPVVQVDPPSTGSSTRSQDPSDVTASPVSSPGVLSVGPSSVSVVGSLSTGSGSSGNPPSQDTLRAKSLTAPSHPSTTTVRGTSAVAWAVALSLEVSDSDDDARHPVPSHAVLESR